MMTFLTLQDQLREHIRARIRRRELTGSGLARAAGFPQGHLSNFLNFRRGLSLESMDRLLETLDLGVDDLLKPKEPRRRGIEHGLEAVALVSAENATRARFTAEQVLGTHLFPRSFLRRLRPSEPHDRGDWERFVLIKLDAERTCGLLPQNTVTTTALIDRYYNSLAPYRRAKPNLYAVDFGEGCAAGYLCLIDHHLVLRPQDPQCALQSVPLAAGRSYAQHIIGRIVHVALEL